jgi:hypothetical protein
MPPKGASSYTARIIRYASAVQMGKLNYLDCCKFVTMQTALRSFRRDVELASPKRLSTGSKLIGSDLDAEIVGGLWQ